MEEETKKLDELPKETKIFNKKWIIFVVIAIILLGAIGSYFYFRSSPVENEDISKEASSEIMGFTEEKSQEGQANQCENKQEIPGETRKLEDLKEVINEGHADAVAMAHVLHYGHHTVEKIRHFCIEQHIPVRHFNH